MKNAADSLAEQSAADRFAAATAVSLAGEIAEDPDAGSPGASGRSLGHRLWGAVRGRPLLGASLVAGGLLGLTAAVAWLSIDEPAASHGKAHAGSSVSAAATPAVSETAADPAFRLQDLSPSEAEIYNAAIPVAEDPNPPAKPFRLKSDNPQDEIRATDCLTAAVYYEAATEPLEGQQAVAQVVLNRLRDPHYPKTVCGVVFQGVELPTGWQFTFVGDGSLARKPSVQGWASAHKVAVAALHGYVVKAVGQATHYHTVWVAPYWSPSLLKVANIGAHIFYRWAGGMGLPRAFTGRYVGGEPFLVQVAALDPAVLDAQLAPPPERLELVTAEKTAISASTPELKAATDMAEASAQGAPNGMSASGSAAAAEGPAGPKPTTVTQLPNVQVHPQAPPPAHGNTWSRLPTASHW